MHTMVNATEQTISPVTLDHSWSRLSRLVFLFIGSCISMISNSFFVASFFVEESLKSLSACLGCFVFVSINQYFYINSLVFLACAGAADLLVTCAVLPTSTVVLLSGEWECDGVCYFLQFLTETSTYAYSLFFALTAAESYLRLCRPTGEYDAFITMRMCIVALVIFLASFIVAGVGVYFGLEYDYCRREHYGNFYYRVTTDVIFHFIPCVITIFCFVNATFAMHRRAKSYGHYRRSVQYDNDRYLNYLNITAYLLYGVAWVPYLITVYETPWASNKRFYHSVWLGVCRTAITSLMYGILNSNFRRAFIHLFNYCCCKSTLSGSFASRNRRNNEHRSNAGDVRVHIMHRAVNSNSPQRATSSIRETQEL